MSFTYQFQPFVPWIWWFVACAIGLAIVAAHFYFRRRGSTLRALSLALLLAALANPVIKQDERERLKDIAIIVVDESASQQIGDRKNQTDKAVDGITKRIAAFGDTEARVVRVRSGTTPETDGTRLYTALDRAKADVPPERYAGSILITDGQVHDVPTPLPKEGPIHGVLTGSRKEIDRRIVIERAPRFAITGQEQSMSFRVEDSDGAPASVAVTVTFPDGQTTVLNVQPNTTETLPFTIAHAGKNLIELNAEPRTGEISTRNNSAIVSIDGIRDRLRVLLVSGEPHPGERTWRNMLKADAGVDLVHFTILRPPEKQDGTPTKELSLIAFPTRELFLEKIDEFDLVIFDRYRRQAVLPDSYLANIADYVFRGGAVLVASGPDYAAEDGLYASPLADILAAAPTGDITEAPFRPVITGDGRKHPVTAKLPGGEGPQPKWGRWFRLIDTTPDNDAKPLLAGPDDKPLLVLSRVGEGRVAQLLSDHGWLWARGYDGGGPQMELLRRSAHWLMKEPDLEEEALRAKQDGSAIVIERRTMAEEAKPVTVTKPSGQSEAVTLTRQEPGLYSGRIEVSETGLHRLSDGTLTAVTAVGSADAKEMTDLRATSDILQPVAQSSGGGIAWFEDGQPRISRVSVGSATAGNGWIGLRDNQQYRVLAVRETSLFATLASLAALLLVVSTLWYREGR